MPGFRSYLLWATLLIFLACPAQAAPQRVLSFNLCADQLVLALADPAQIAGLSPFAADPGMSVMAEAAKSFPVTDARSEAAVAVQPDLVLTGPFDRSSLRQALTRLGLTVAEIGLVADIDAARAQVREVAALLGHPSRGEALIAEIDAAVARLAAVAQGPRRTALIVERKGHVTGPEGLAASLLRGAGLVPPEGAPGGLGGFVALERLLLLQPDILVLYEGSSVPSDQGAVYLTHPALRRLYPPARRLILPQRFALCGGPALVRALDDLTRLIAAPNR